MLCKWPLHHADKTPQIVQRNANVFQMGVEHLFRFDLEILFISDRISLSTNRISNIQIMLLTEIVNRKYMGK
jgi:hypothetical protein